MGLFLFLTFQFQLAPLPTSSPLADHSSNCYPPRVPDRTIETNDGLPTVHGSPQATNAVGPMASQSAVNAGAATLVHGSSPSWSDRFPPGTMLASRYRIIARLGHGGMGEVYRADDLELGASVALKFLPMAVATDPLRLDRMRAEVRLARQVSHPNVCRVYDIVFGEVSLAGSVGSNADNAGTTSVSSPTRVGESRVAFLTMEYIDGENLQGLLGRIGLLPKEKAIDVSRQLCFALAAVHEQGIVHRDLKPANIMIDGRGRARLTDFGIADLGQSLAQGSGVAGTPAYMSPEQAAGEPPTKRSDIYSLGLVLYEIFTGHAAVEADTLADVRRVHSSGSMTSPSRFVDDLDPTVERAILRCLEASPADRPNSALALAAALPGGDPIQAALAAGETPSPEMVAESGRSAGLSLRTATICLAACLLCAVAVMALQDRTALHRIVSMPNSSEVMISKSREILKSLGFSGEPKNWAGGWLRDGAAWSKFVSLPATSKPASDTDPDVAGSKPAGRLSPQEQRQFLRDGSVPFMNFWYRQSPDSLSPALIWQPRTMLNSPPDESAGAITMILDPAGRLLVLRVVPEVMLDEAESKNAGKPMDWGPVFKHAGLDFDAFEATTPVRTPPRFGDSRLAWVERRGFESLGVFGPRRVEATSLGGRPVNFRVYLSHEVPESGLRSLEVPRRVTIVEEISNLLFFGGIVFAIVLGVVHLRRNRGDRRGAIRLATCAGLAQLLGMALAPDRLGAVFSSELLNRPVGRAMWVAGFCWVLYMAIEPPMRRIRPQALVSWVRLLSGKWRDPLVGRDVLLGATFAFGMSFVLMIGTLIGSMVQGVSASIMTNLDSLMGPRQLLAFGLSGVVAMLALSFFGAFGFVGLCLLLKRVWLASVVVLIVVAVPFLPTLAVDPVAVVINLTIVAALLVVLQRSGVLGLLAAASTLQLVLTTPLTLDLSSWQGGLAIFGMAIPLSLAVYGYRVTISGAKWGGTMKSGELPVPKFK